MLDEESAWDEIAGGEHDGTLMGSGGVAPSRRKSLTSRILQQTIELPTAAMRALPAALRGRPTVSPPLPRNRNSPASPHHDYAAFFSGEVEDDPKVRRMGWGGSGCE